MPQINLLSPTLKKIEKRLVSSEPAKFDFSSISQPLIFRSSICLGILFVIWIFIFVNISKKERSLKRLEGDVQALASNPKEMERLHNERSALEKKIKLIDNLSSRKFFWHEKLMSISNLIPEGVWLREVSSSQEKVVDKGGAGQKGEVFSERTALVIKGVAMAYKIEDAVTLIDNLIKNLKNNNDFSKDFTEIRLNNIAKGAVGSLDVMLFDLLCLSK